MKNKRTLELAIVPVGSKGTNLIELLGEFINESRYTLRTKPRGSSGKEIVLKLDDSHEEYKMNKKNAEIRELEAKLFDLHEFCAETEKKLRDLKRRSEDTILNFKESKEKLEAQLKDYKERVADELDERNHKIENQAAQLIRNSNTIGKYNAQLGEAEEVLRAMENNSLLKFFFGKYVKQLKCALLNG